MALPKLEGVYTVGDSESVDVTEIGGGGGPVSVALTAGDYSLTELLTHLADVLTSDGTLSGTYSASVSDDADASTGIVTISATGITSFVLEWDTATGTRDALGYADDLSPTALTFATPGSSPFIWLPNTGRSDAKGSDGGRGEPVRSVAVNTSTSGAVYSWASASLRYEDVLEWMGLKGFKTIAGLEVVANESLQTFFINVISKGLTFRYHADRSVDGTYTEHVAKQPSAERLSVNPRIKAWRGAQSLWDWRCEAYAPASAVAAAAAWSPIDLSPAFWTRSDLGVTVTGSGVSAWADQSGNTRDLTMTTDAQRPPLVSADLNGQNVLRFVGGTKQLVWASPWAQPNEATVIMVGRCVTGAAVQQAVSRSGGSGPICYTSVTSLRPATYTGAAARADWGSDLTATTAYVVSWSWNVSSTWHKVRVNAGTEVEDATASSAAVNFSDVGATSGGMEWDVAEIIIVASELTAGQHSSLMTYASTRYGV